MDAEIRGDVGNHRRNMRRHARRLRDDRGIQVGHEVPTLR
jgi:hypothetical protein